MTPPDATPTTDTSATDHRTWTIRPLLTTLGSLLLDVAEKAGIIVVIFSTISFLVDLPWAVFIPLVLCAGVAMRRIVK